MQLNSLRHASDRTVLRESRGRIGDQFPHAFQDTDGIYSYVTTRDEVGLFVQVTQEGENGGKHDQQPGLVPLPGLSQPSCRLASQRVQRKCLEGTHAPRVTRN